MSMQKTYSVYNRICTCVCVHEMLHVHVHCVHTCIYVHVAGIDKQARWGGWWTDRVSTGHYAHNRSVTNQPSTQTLPCWFEASQLPDYIVDMSPRSPASIVSHRLIGTHTFVHVHYMYIHVYIMHWRVDLGRAFLLASICTKVCVHARELKYMCLSINTHTPPHMQ